MNHDASRKLRSHPGINYKFYCGVLVVAYASITSYSYTTLKAINKNKSSTTKTTSNTPLINPLLGPRLELVHIPKTGGTWMEQAYAQSVYKGRWGACHFMHPKISLGMTKGALECPPAPFSAKLLYNYNHDTLKKTKFGCFGESHWWHVPPWLFDDEVAPENNPYHDADRFAVVRDPYDKVVSEYYWRHTVELKLPLKTLTKEHMNNWVKEMITNRFQYFNHTAHWIESHDYCRWNNHWVPQSLYIFHPTSKKQIVKHILFYEEGLHLQFQKLMSDYGLNVTLPRVSKALQRSVQHDRWPIDALSLQNRQFIEALYYQDFHNFGYSFLPTLDD